MRTRLIYTICATLIFFLNCRKEDNPVLPDGLLKAPLPQFTKDSSTDLSIPGQNPAAFSAKFTIDQYYQHDPSFSSFDIVIRKNGDNSSVKVLQQNVTQLPSTYTLTGEQLTTLFGPDIIAGDYFDVGADAILAGGTRIEAFSADGFSSYDPNISSLPNAAPTITYSVLCQFDAAAYNGNFVVIQDDWNDYQPGDVIPVTMIDATHISFKYAALDAQPIIVQVDPATNTATVTKQYYGNYGAAYGNWFVETVAGNVNNYVAPCQGLLSLVLDQSSDVYGDQGPYTIVLQKQ